MCWSHNTFMSHPALSQNVGCNADASYPTYGKRMCWSHNTFMPHPALSQNVGCDADASYPTYGKRMCWSHNTFMPHPATVPKMSDAALTRLIRPTGSAYVDHIMRLCCIRLLCPKCRMRRWRILSDLRGVCVGHIIRSCRIRLLCLKCRMQRWRALSDLRGTHVLVT